MNTLAVPDLEQLSLHELMPFWGRWLWVVGMQPVVQRMLEADLTHSECVVLQNLRRDALTVAEVGDCLCISHSAASRAVDRLVRDGFVSRQENLADRRQKQLTLTSKGEQLASEMEGILAARVESLVDALSDEEREQCRRLLVRMIASQLARVPECPGLVDSPAGQEHNGASHHTRSTKLTAGSS